ncbi:MAG: hypothetical protein R3A80_05645 [Bdellovibrionota bacterium]
MLKHIVHCLILILFLTSLESCSDKPSRERFPGPIGRTTDVQQAQKTKEVLGGFDPTANKLEEGKAIRGIIRLKKGLKIPAEHYMIFISARSLGGGPPLAATRLSPRKIPFRFTLSQANVMMQGTTLEGFVEVTVRISQPKPDGSYDPLTRQKGDLFGSKRVQVGTNNLELEINESVE